MSVDIISKKDFPNYHLAYELISQIRADIDDLDDLDPLFLIDMMAIIGIQFTKGSDCSSEYIKLCGMR